MIHRVPEKSVKVASTPKAAGETTGKRGRPSSVKKQ
jgi:hypothetical protein